MSASPTGCKVLVIRLPEQYPSGSDAVEVGPVYKRLAISQMDNVTLWSHSLPCGSGSGSGSGSSTIVVDMTDRGLLEFLEDLARFGVGGAGGEHSGARWKFARYV